MRHEAVVLAATDGGLRNQLRVLPVDELADGLDVGGGH